MKHATAFLTALLTLTACNSTDPAEDFMMCRNRVYSPGFDSAKYGTCAQEKQTVMRDQSNSLQRTVCYLDQNWYRIAAWEKCGYQCDSDKLECLDRLCKEEPSYGDRFTTNETTEPCHDESLACVVRCAEATYPNSPPKEGE